MLQLKNIKEKRLDRIDYIVAEALMEFENLVLAGGAIRDALFDKTISDYDLFLTDSSVVESVKQYFLDNGFTNVFTCPLGQLFTYMKGEDFKKPEECTKVQIIHKRSYSDVADLLNSFDFSVTYFAMQYDNREEEFVISTSWQAIKDVRKKQVSLVNLEYPSSTINRLYKYRKKGYYVGHVIKEIVAAINTMGTYDPENDTLYVD